MTSKMQIERFPAHDKLTDWQNLANTDVMTEYCGDLIGEFRQLLTLCGSLREALKMSEVYEQTFHAHFDGKNKRSAIRGFKRKRKLLLAKASEILGRE